MAEVKKIDVRKNGYTKKESKLNFQVKDQFQAYKVKKTKKTHSKNTLVKKL